MANPRAPNYVLVGNVAVDRIGPRERLGGTVLYAGVAALRLGRTVGIVTACHPSLAFPPELATAQVARQDARATTTFSHEVVGPQRRLRLLGPSPRIDVRRAPRAWLAAPIVHVAPIMGEIRADEFGGPPAGMFVTTPQGWLRTAQRDESVSFDPIALEQAGIDRFRAAVLSIEDIAGNEVFGEQLSKRLPIIVITRGASGCTLYTEGVRTDFPAFAAENVDSTGAGDVFAAAFFVRLDETGDPRASARFAACAAALSVEGEGVSHIPDRVTIEARLHASD